MRLEVHELGQSQLDEVLQETAPLSTPIETEGTHFRGFLEGGQGVVAVLTNTKCLLAFQCFGS